MLLQLYAASRAYTYPIAAATGITTWSKGSWSDMEADAATRLATSADAVGGGMDVLLEQRWQKVRRCLKPEDGLVSSSGTILTTRLEASSCCGRFLQQRDWQRSGNHIADPHWACECFPLQQRCEFHIESHAD